MKIEYVEINLKTVLEYFQKDFKKDGKPIKNFGQPLVDVVAGIVVFKLYLENNEQWDNRFPQHAKSKNKK